MLTATHVDEVRWRCALATRTTRIIRSGDDERAIVADDDEQQGEEARARRRKLWRDHAFATMVRCSPLRAVSACVALVVAALVYVYVLLPAREMAVRSGTASGGDQGIALRDGRDDVDPLMLWEHVQQPLLNGGEVRLMSSAPGGDQGKVCAL